MTVHQRPRDEAHPAASSATPGRKKWNWYRVAQVAWVVLALGMLAIIVISLPTYFQYVGTVCTLHDLSNCATDQLAPVYVQFFHQLHLPIALAAGFFAVLTFAVAVLYWVVALLIFWRKSGEWIGLSVSLVLVIISVVLVGTNVTEQSPQLLQLLANFFSNFVLGPAVALFLFTFPTGRFNPRWSLVAFVLGCVLIVLSSLPVTSSLIPSGLVAALAFLLAFVVQVYRYVRVYDAVQQQQTKWFIFGTSIVVSLLVMYGLLGAVAPTAPWNQLFTGPFWLLVWTILLLSVAFPILRYRLWDIDVIINRTLVYGSLTILLVALYVALILALQALVGAVTGSLSQQPLVIVASTLVIAALFQPLRRRLQNSIDRRFYRRKYDAAKVMAAFSATLRNEVDLDRLRQHLLEVVQETMQPTQVSLWLRQPTHRATPSLQTSKAPTEKARELEQSAGHGV
ncbi:MAG TPA: hypothetical protein VIY29_18905 [Ktedonobacteraceae bacterium]